MFCELYLNKAVGTTTKERQKKQQFVGSIVEHKAVECSYYLQPRPGLQVTALLLSFPRHTTTF